MTPLLHLPDLIELTGLSDRTLRQAIKSGELKGAKLRGRIVVRPEDFDAWFEANVLGPTADLERRPVRRRTPVSRPSANGSDFYEWAKAVEAQERRR
jgi:excisionase family DNA binding protein